MEEVKDFCNYNNVHVMMLFETKVQSPLLEGSIRYGRWNLLIWKDNVSNPFIYCSKKSDILFVGCNKNIISMNFSFFAIFIYAPPRQAHKHAF